MTTFYLICFTLGLSLTLLSALGVFTHLHFGHLHLSHGGGHGHIPGTHGGGVKSSVSPVNGFTLAAFLCWFGGCGYLLSRADALAAFTILLLAMLTGAAGAAMLFWFLVRVLLPHEHELTAADTETVGVLGLVSGPIREGGTGEIQFSQNGVRRFAPARSDAGVALPRGTEVVVMRYEQGIAYVRPWDELSGEPIPRVAAEPARWDSSAIAATSTHSSNAPDGKDQAL